MEIAWFGLVVLSFLALLTASSRWAEWEGLIRRWLERVRGRKARPALASSTSSTSPARRLVGVRHKARRHWLSQYRATGIGWKEWRKAWGIA